MQTYGEYAPTSFDTKGLALDDQQNWLVVIGRNRDSDHLAQSNFDCALKALGGESDDVEVHRFGHWACGWLEIIIVRPDTDAANEATEIESCLADYPLLDENDLSKREYEAYNEEWESWGAREFRSELVRKLDLDEATEERLDDAGQGELQEFFESLVPSGCYMEDGSPVIRRAMHDVTIDNVIDFLDSLDDKSPALL